LTETVLITGASGPLGRALARVCREAGHPVWPVGRSPKPIGWLEGDLTTPEGVEQFLHHWEGPLGDVGHVFWALGPLEPRSSGEVSGQDLMEALYANAGAVADLMGRLRLMAPVRSLTLFGFQQMGEDRAWKNLLPYAVAKEALYRLFRSWCRDWAPMKINLVSPGTIQGAAHAGPGATPLEPDAVARSAWELVRRQAHGEHLKISDGGC